VLGSYWYWGFYFRNILSDQKRQLHVYGWRSFLPHRHIPAGSRPETVPTAAAAVPARPLSRRDGWRCSGA